MKELAELLGLPDKLPLRNRKGKVDRTVALGVLLSFLAFPKRQRTDLELLWWMDRRRSPSTSVFTWMVGRWVGRRLIDHTRL